MVPKDVLEMQFGTRDFGQVYGPSWIAVALINRLESLQGPSEECQCDAERNMPRHAVEQSLMPSVERLCTSPVSELTGP